MIEESVNTSDTMDEAVSSAANDSDRRLTGSVALCQQLTSETVGQGEETLSDNDDGLQVAMSTTTFSYPKASAEDTDHKPKGNTTALRPRCVPSHWLIANVTHG